MLEITLTRVQNPGIGCIVLELRRRTDACNREGLLRRRTDAFNSEGKITEHFAQEGGFPRAIEMLELFETTHASTAQLSWPVTYFIE